MPRTSRLALASAAIAAMAWTGTAGAAVTGTPDFVLAPFTTAGAGAGGGVALAMRWQAVAFAPATADDHYDVTTTELPSGSPQTHSAGTATSLSPLAVEDGRPLRVTVAACQTAGPCGAGAAAATHETMVDATPPSGTVAIDGGAAATDDRAVTLALTATDPLVQGRPGTASGVDQVAVDVDGDGTYPCDVLVGGVPVDHSGCARAFATTAAVTLPAGDGVKVVGVRFGDAARDPAVPCAGPLCGVPEGPLLGNVSLPATDTILLDTVAPVARVTQDAVSASRGEAAAFDAAPSTDPGPATPSGVDFPATTWDFADGTPPVAGARVDHAFADVGTYVGRVRVRDRAGNVSDARSFTVTVLPAAGETVDGSGSVAGVRGSADFALSRISVTARYDRSRLLGSILVSGVSSRRGTIVATVRRTARGPALVTARRAVRAAAFSQGIRLPHGLLPGDYLLGFAGPGGTLSSTLTLRPPREGVATASGRTIADRPAARFAFAAPPVPRLRSKLAVAWTQGARRLGAARVGFAPVVTARLPTGVRVTGGRLTATLRAGTTVVAVVGGPVRRGRWRPGPRRSRVQIS